MSSLLRMFIFLSFVFTALPLLGQTPDAGGTVRGSSLQAFSRSIEELADHVGGAVVGIVASGYAFSLGDEGKGIAPVSTQFATGSGSILSSDGYIMTNAHIVKSAQKVTVLLSRATNQGLRVEERLPATIVGIDEQTDLALLKVNKTGLPRLELASTVPVRQGQIVLAFGSPRGLSNSVTMGVVSAPYRQVNERDPVRYIQTDAPINPGNSGGPLVDPEGHLLGINTFILSQSGGSEGLGFAIPARVVQYVYEQFIKNGRVRRGLVGASAAKLSDALIEGLALPISSGVVIEDVAPGGPADRAGLKIGDVVLSADGVLLEDARQMAVHVFGTSKNQVIKLDVRRGTSQFTLNVVADEQPELSDKFKNFTLTAPEHLIESLGVFGLDITDEVAAMLPPLRLGYGVAVAARAPSLSLQAVDLQVGDVIHEINRSPILSLNGLREKLRQFKPGDAIVLQIERNGALQYAAFRTE